MSFTTVTLLGVKRSASFAHTKFTSAVAPRLAWISAYKRAAEWLDDRFYSSPEEPIVKFFFSDGTELIEYTADEVRELARQSFLEGVSK